MLGLIVIVNCYSSVLSQSLMHWYILQAVIVVIANHSSQSDPMIVSKAQGWTVREKLKYYDACAMDRASLYDAFVYLASRLYQQVAKSSFSQLGMRKKDWQATFYVSIDDDWRSS